jgi:hypothetical protein
VLTGVDRRHAKKEKYIGILDFSRFIENVKIGPKWGIKRKNLPFGRSLWEKSLVL